MTSAVIGRPIELAAIQQEIGLAKDGRLSALTVEGEPGIGKTRLLMAASELAGADGFATIAVATDQEIRGPFLLARSIVGSADAVLAAEGTPAAEAIQRSLDALSGKEEPGLESLPPDQKLLRTLDLAAVAFRTLAAQRPVALLLDDLQWADDDSLRLIRYLVRADAATQGSWQGVYGGDGYQLVNDAARLPAYAQLTPSNQLSWTWAPSSTVVLRLSISGSPSVDFSRASSSRTVNGSSP